MIAAVLDASALAAYARVDRAMPVAELIRVVNDEQRMLACSVFSIEMAWMQLGDDERRRLEGLLTGDTNVFVIEAVHSENVLPVLRESVSGLVSAELAHAARLTLAHGGGITTSLATFTPHAAKLVLAETAILDLGQDWG